MLHRGRISFYSPFVRYLCGDKFCLNLLEENQHSKEIVIFVAKILLFLQVQVGIQLESFAEIVQKIKKRKNDEERVSSLL